MNVFAIVCLALWVIGLLLYRAADRATDDFGAGVFAWLFLIIAAICTLILIGRALWY